MSFSPSTDDPEVVYDPTRFWIIEPTDNTEPCLPDPSSARYGNGPLLIPIVDEEYGGVIAWANTYEQAHRIIRALEKGEGF